MKKTLLVDFSPISYRWGFGGIITAKNKYKLKPDKNGIYDFDKYKDIFIFNIIEEIANFKNQFNVDEVIIAVDSKPYWRKDHWSGYKYNRKKNDKSGIDWEKQGKASTELLNMLDEYSNTKVIRKTGIEGDDILFVLSKELSDRGHNIIVHSLDHDIIYCTENKNTKYWQTKHAAKTKTCGFVTHTQDEIDNLKWEHCFFGDKGDYIWPIVRYTQFSPEFLKLYPDKDELSVWPKRHEIDIAFINKHSKDFPDIPKNKLSAYKHPPFGAKNYAKKKLKEGFTNKEFIARDPIHKLNFDLNAKIALPENIPDDIRRLIIDQYDKDKGFIDKSPLTQYFIDNGMFEMLGKIGQL